MGSPRRATAVWQGKAWHVRPCRHSAPVSAATTLRQGTRAGPTRSGKRQCASGGGRQRTLPPARVPRCAARRAHRAPRAAALLVALLAARHTWLGLGLGLG
eukprot:scaffold109991_cov45-Phaeocystis_antarctica.AAC.1